MFRTVTFDPKFREQFKALNLEWISTHFKVEKKDEEQLSNPEAIVEGGGEVFFILGEGDDVVGTAALIKTGKGEFELAKMAVRPDMRGKKLGDVLMKETQTWARLKNAKRLHLISNTDLEAAIALYLKHGWQVVSVGQQPDYERGNIVMQKTF